MPVRKVADILGDSPDLTSLTVVARRATELQRVYSQIVPAQLGQASRIGWVRAGVLFVAAANGAVAAKLRQLAPRILDRFSREGFEFNAMRIEVQVGHGAARRPAKAARRPLSAKALASICRTANGLTDSPLKAALARLARSERRHQRTRSKT
jgi:hypothetical protein